MDLEIVVSAESEWGAGDVCEQRKALVLAQSAIRVCLCFPGRIGLGVTLW